MSVNCYFGFYLDFIAFLEALNLNFIIFCIFFDKIMYKILKIVVIFSNLNLLKINSHKHI